MSEQSQPIVIVGAGEQADIAYEYFTHDSPHTVVGFAVEQAYLDEREHVGLPVVALETLAESHPPAGHQAFVAISSQQLNRVRQRLDRVRQSPGVQLRYVRVLPRVRVAQREGRRELHDLRRQRAAALRRGQRQLRAVERQPRRPPLAASAHTRFVSSHVVISGFVEIGEHCFLGVNSSFGDELAIADDTVVGAGAVVVKPIVEPRGVWVGNPAKATGRDSFQTFKVEA